MPSELERAVAFLRLGDRAGSRTERFRFGTASFNPELPLRHDSNCLDVEDLPEDVSAAELAAEADRVMSAAGLGHRKLEVRDEATARRLDPGFRELGWEVNRHVLMLLRRPPEKAADTGVVTEVDEAALRPARTRMLARESWGRDPEVARQLLDAKLFIGRILETRFFAVLVNGKPVSYADLYLGDSTAQIEDVATLEKHRGHGYASAVVLRAADGAREAGCDFIFLIADDEDWPKELYRRLGFDELGLLYEFVRRRKRATSGRRA